MMMMMEKCANSRVSLFQWYFMEYLCVWMEKTIWQVLVTYVIRYEKKKGEPGCSQGGR